MQYRQLGQTDLTAGVVGVGCMTFGWRADAKEVAAIVSAALDVGINLFDTSVSYGRGVSETLLGDALQKSGRRDELLIATKFGQAATPNAKSDEIGNSRRVLMAQCELSLRRLQTDRIDLLQIHNFSADVPLEETLGGLDQLVRDGKVRQVGCSNFDGAQLAQAVSVTDRLRLHALASVQSRFNLLDRRAEADVMERARRYGMANLVYGPLSEGLLTGKYQSGQSFPVGSRFAAASPTNNYESRLTHGVMQTLKRLEEVAVAHSLSLWQLALAWVLNVGAVSCVLVGPSTSRQVADLESVVDVALSDETMALLGRISPAGTTAFSDPAVA
jgi:aryl-alcohol dehydrogenase-like predicted oxidoreductase